jgi:drug/metabolite transporter (DMT)-like permease
VVIAVASNWRTSHGPQSEGRLPWRRLLPSLALIAVGIALVNRVELAHLQADPQADLGAYALGGLLALGAVACWTWYPIRNAEWLRAHAERSPRTWATAQGLATLPLAAAGLLGTWAWMAAQGGSGFALPFGPRPAQYLGLMLAMGLFASWIGTLCWNEASQRLPTALVGQLIVFETLAALAYGYGLRGEWPTPITAVGIALLVAGVIWALRRRAAPADAR